MSQASFQKRMREKARRERAQAKTARKQERRDSRSDGDEAPSGPVDETALLAELAALHARFAADEMTFEDFEEAKAALMAQLDVR